MLCQCVGHISNTDTPRTHSKHCVRHIFGVSNFLFYLLGLGHAANTSLDTQRTPLFFLINFLKNKPKRLDYKIFFLKLTYFDNLFHITFYLLLFYSRLRFAPFARHYPFTFSSTPVPLVIFHSSLPRWHLVVLLGWLCIHGFSVRHFILFFFSSSLTFLSFRVFLVHPLFALI